MKDNKMNTELLNIINDVSLVEAFTLVNNVRLQRQKIYGDSWKEQENWELMAKIKDKCGRLKSFIIDQKDKDVYENEVDTLIDGINYQLFLLANILRDKNEK